MPAISTNGSSHDSKKSLILKQLKEMDQVKYTTVNEDPFANAYQENLRLEAKSDEKKMRQEKFESDLKKRLRAYKKVKSQMSEDCQLKVQESNKLTNFNTAKKTVKFDYIEDGLNGIHISEDSSKKSARSLRPNSARPSPCYSSLSESGKSTNSLNSLLVEPNKTLVRSLKSDLQSIEKKKADAKKRIMLVRRTYGNFERQNASKLKQLKESEQPVIPTAPRSQKHNQQRPESLENSHFIDDEPEACERRANSPSNFLRKNKRRTSNSTQKQVVKERGSDSKKSAPSLDRYIHYLKQMIKEKSQQQKRDIPTLCQCNCLATFIWETDWNTCANNCIFYNNPKEYARVLVNIVNRNTPGKEVHTINF